MFKLKKYSSYTAMMNDAASDVTSGDYAIITNTGAMYKRVGDSWIHGFVDQVGGIDLNYYTAFEVFAHSEDIPVGESDVLGGYVNNLIPANMTHLMVLRTMQPDFTKSDVIVDWGDGSISSIANGDYETQEYADVEADTENGEANYTLKHTYTSNGVYVVRVYGKNYYNIRGYAVCSDGTRKHSNLISKFITSDLPLARHYRNLSQMCFYAHNLLHVNAELIKYDYFVNITGLFGGCDNLITAIGFKRNFTRTSCHGAFDDCISLSNTDMQLATESVYAGGASYQYKNCQKLSKDISSLIPEVSCRGGIVNIDYAFAGCTNLYGTVPADKLWNNKLVTWVNTSTAFIGCSDAIRSQVPISWGGTASDDLITKVSNIWFGTQAQYDALATKDNTVLYLIKEEV